MKKTLLATAIVSSLVSAAAQSAAVYDKDGTAFSVGGRAEVRGLFGDAVDGTMEDKSRARINFAGKTQLSETLAAFGFVEYEIDRENSETEVDSRYLYAGFATTAGDFSYGKQDTANVQVSDLTDIASYHSGIQQYIAAASDKQDNNFAYAGNFLDEALTVKANFIADDVKDNDAVALSALYSLDFGLDLALSYADQDEQNQITAGVAYTLNDLYLAATYAMGDVAADDEFTSLEVAAQYKFSKEFRLIGMYGMAEEDVKGDTEDFVALEAQYRFNNAIRSYASYKLDNLDDGDNELLVGLRYDF